MTRAPREPAPSLRDRQRDAVRADIHAAAYRLFAAQGFTNVTTDDIEALEQCQEGFRNEAETGWNDISKGLTKEEPSFDDEAQMRGYWTEWNRRMYGVCFAVDHLGDIYLTGRLPLHAVTARSAAQASFMARRSRNSRTRPRRAVGADRRDVDLPISGACRDLAIPPRRGRGPRPASRARR